MLSTFTMTAHIPEAAIITLLQRLPYHVEVQCDNVVRYVRFVLSSIDFQPLYHSLCCQNGAMEGCVCT